MKIATRYSVRPMEMGDIRQVMEIEREAFPAGWPQTAYQRELTKNKMALYYVAIDEAAGAEDEPVARSRAGPLVSLGRLLHVNDPEASGERIVGFVGLWKMVDEGHIVTFAVREALRRRGIGEVLLSKAFEVAQAQGLPTLTLEVRPSNEAAQTLYERWGFRRLGLRKRYYSDNKEDAVIMTTDDLASPALQETLAERRRRLVERGLLE